MFLEFCDMTSYLMFYYEHFRVLFNSTFEKYFSFVVAPWCARSMEASF